MTKEVKTVRKAKANDGVCWVVSVRNRLFGWTPFAVYTTAKKANAKRLELEDTSVLGRRYAKVDRVILGK